MLGHVTGGVAPVSLQNFDDGLLTGYTFIGPNLASVTAAAAHDGPFGLQIGSFTEWMWRNDSAVAVQQGDTISAWVQAAGAPTGRIYFGFGASATGTLSMVLGGNTSTLNLQRNAGFGFLDIGVVPQTWVANKWYRFEMVWGVGGSITGRLFDSDGTTLLNTVTATDTTITSGGLAFRGFGPTHFVDSVQKGGQRNDDWYSVTVIQGRLQFETSTPGDGPGEFVNTLDPHIELFDSTGATLIATGDPLEDGRNESINVSGLPAPATYLVRVTGEGGTRWGILPRNRRSRPSAGFCRPSATTTNTMQVLRYRSSLASVSTWDSTSSLRARCFHAKSTARRTAAGRMLALDHGSRQRAWREACNIPIGTSTTITGKRIKPGRALAVSWK